MMRTLTGTMGVTCLVWTAVAQAEPCYDFRTLAMMPPATVATHERGADPNWFDASEQLSDLTLFDEPCTIGLAGGGAVANVTCHVNLKAGVGLDSFFDAVDDCLKDKAKQMSRDPGQGDHIWTAGGAMVKMWRADGDQVNVRFVY